MKKERLISLDVFRGFTVLLMTIVNNPGSWAHIYNPLEHSKWNGCTPADLVFPFFIFIMGTAIPFAMPNKQFDLNIFNKITVRSLRILCLGLFLNYFSEIELFDLEGTSLLALRMIITAVVAYALLGKFSLKIKTYFVVLIFFTFLFLAFVPVEDFKNVRIPGVLQRIGIVYFFTSILYLKTTQKTQLWAVALLLITYWFLLAFVPVPGIGAANFEKGTNLTAWLDNLILEGHLRAFTKTWDPAGVLSTLPAIASGIAGLLIGQILHLKIPKIEIIKKTASIGIILTIIGIIWDSTFPINKALWSSSYVLFTAGLATISLTILYYIIDILNYKKWTKLFIIWGVNPMIVFFLSGIFPRAWSMIKLQSPEIALIQIDIKDYFYIFYITPSFSNPLNASLAFALLYVLLWTLILWVLYKNKIIFKV